MQATRPTFAPHPAPHALVMRVEPGEQPQLVGWVDVAGKRRRVKWRGFLQLRGCEGVLRAAPRHATQHQHLGRPSGQRTFHKRARHERSFSHLEYLQQHVSPRALAERLVVHAAVIRAALVRDWLCEWYNGTTFQNGWRRSKENQQVEEVGLSQRTCWEHHCLNSGTSSRHSGRMWPSKAPCTLKNYTEN